MLDSLLWRLTDSKQTQSAILASGDTSIASAAIGCSAGRQFYKYVPPRPLEEIDAEIRALEEEIQRLLREVTA